MSKQQSGSSYQADLDRMIERLASDPTYRQELLAQPAAALADAGIVDSQPDVTGYRIRATGCGPLSTSCPPMATCPNGVSCLKTSISVVSAAF